MDALCPPQFDWTLWPCSWRRVSVERALPHSSRLVPLCSALLSDQLTRRRWTTTQGPSSGPLGFAGTGEAGGKRPRERSQYILCKVGHQSSASFHTSQIHSHAGAAPSIESTPSPTGLPCCYVRKVLMPQQATAPARHVPEWLRMMIFLIPISSLKHSRLEPHYYDGTSGSQVIGIMDSWASSSRGAFPHSPR